MNKEEKGLKKIISYHLFWPLVCLAVVLLINLVKTPTFFNISINNGVLYGYLIDVLNRSSELIILAVGMTLVAVSYTHLTLPTKNSPCRSRWSPYH